MSAAASRGAPKSLASDLSDLIVAGQQQSERAERYIRSAAEVAFFDDSGKRAIQRIRVADYRKIFRIVVTRENLGWVGAKIAVLSVVDPQLSKSYPWHISLDDLRMVADLFDGKNVEFVHFLEARLQASSTAALEQHDEIEHVGLYFKLNQYYELPVRRADSYLSFDPRYMKDIDVYFSARHAGESPQRPEQRLPQNLKRLIEALKTSGLAGRFEAASILLSMGQRSSQRDRSRHDRSGRTKGGGRAA